MQTFIILLKKEFRQLVRDRFLLRIMVLMPIIQLLVLPLAANYEIRNFNMAVIDHDGSTLSTRMISKIQAGGYFTLVGRALSWDEARNWMTQGRTDLIVEIPRYFERDIALGRGADLSVHISAVNGLSAGVAGGYLNSILSNYSAELIDQKLAPPSVTIAGSYTTDDGAELVVPQIDVSSQLWYNPNFDYKITIVPGILALLITVIGMAVSALSIVKEKQSGTIEQINVTPLSPVLFMLAKMAPFFLIGIAQFAIGLTLAYYVYSIPVVGSLWLLLAILVIYMIGLLGLGFTIANISESQVQVMFAIFFFVMIMVLMSGLFTPVESMPLWAQRLNLWNPVAHMITVLKMVLIKGSGASDLGLQWLCLSLFAVVSSLLSIITFRKLHP